MSTGAPSMHCPFNLHDTRILDAPLSTLSMTADPIGLEDMFERVEDQHRSMMSMLAQLTSDFSSFAEPRVHLCPQHVAAVRELAQLAVARTDERVEKMEQRVERMKQRMVMMEQRLEKLERKLDETERTEKTEKTGDHTTSMMGAARDI